MHTNALIPSIFWILRGREAIRHIQHLCKECRRWKAKPSVPKMSDLPVARLRLHKLAFYSTGVDCFGPFQVKLGRRSEKRWGIIYKCLTTRAVHLDLLHSMDSDSFLMSLRRFTARRGTPAELYSDQGTNFKAGEKELRETFDGLSSELQQLLAKQKIAFHFNPPAAPHFGGAWEREIRSVNSALYTVIGAQPVTEEILRTVLLEVEAILNTKPLGYTSSSIADLDAMTPNMLDGAAGWCFTPGGVQQERRPEQKKMEALPGFGRSLLVEVYKVLSANLTASAKVAYHQGGSCGRLCCFVDGPTTP